MKAKELSRQGIPRGDIMKTAVHAIAAAAGSGKYPAGFTKLIPEIVADPQAFTDDPFFGKLARLLSAYKKNGSDFQERVRPAPFYSWGSGFEAEALLQMRNACRLPVAVRGALMPDAHVGYGLPIGGVLAVRNAVIPYAVGVDIACRMKMTVLDLPVTTFDDRLDLLKSALSRETSFGVGATRTTRYRHPVMDLDWNFSTVTRHHKDKAWAQLGTSGSGNHFVEFGIMTVDRDDFTLPRGRYLALLSHSGSRGTGNEIARYYSTVALGKHTGLPRELSHLAWLPLDSHAGAEYWEAMQLMGKYAAANHELIHLAIARNLGAEVLLDMENHHNFAWKEEFDGEELIIHRKGATPAAIGCTGIIPGSMGTPGFVVRGKGCNRSLNSASHGAGRKMSRTAAKAQFTWNDITTFLRERNIILMSAGLDEAPMAYKDIEYVMAAQEELVEPLAKFEPRLVRMAPEHERPED